MRGQAQNLFTDQINRLIEVLKTQILGAFMTAPDKLFNLAFVLLEERIDVLQIQQAGALSLGEDEIAEEKETDPAIEGEPAAISAVLYRITKSIPSQNKNGPGLSEQNNRQDDPVNQPWRQFGGVRGAKSFVGGEDGEEDGNDGAVILARIQFSFGQNTHDSKSAKMPNMMLDCGRGKVSRVSKGSYLIAEAAAGDSFTRPKLTDTDDGYCDQDTVDSRWNIEKNIKEEKKKRHERKKRKGALPIGPDD